jgi:hypothetical protein
MERDQLIQKLLQQQQNRCFICEEPIDPVLDKIEIDHIKPRAKGGKDDENNYAATHESCNREKWDADLRVARCLAHYNKIKEAKVNEGPNRPNLQDFLEEYGGGKYILRAVRNDDTLTYSTPDINNKKHELPILKDKLSGLDYVFINLPVEYIHHDSRINPRAVGPRIRGLISEFLDGKPQLHIALAWGVIEDNSLKVQVFDGQHKAVAQILLGVRQLPFRLFINPNLNLLLEANTNAGTTLKQVAFDQATQRFLGSTLYWEKIDEYRQVSHRSPDDMSFSEQDLVNYFQGERREVSRYIIDDVRVSIMYDPENKLRDYIEMSGRLGEKPLSYGTIEKTLFSLFIRQKPMMMPLNYKMDLEENPRQLEKAQLVRLANIITETIYLGHFDFDLGSNKIEDKVRQNDPIPDDHLRAVRLSREEVLFNILRYVRDLIKLNFASRGQVVEEEELFQHKFTDELWDTIRNLFVNMGNLPVWTNHQMSGTVFAGKQDHEYWKIIFDTGCDRMGNPILAKPLNLLDFTAK